MEEKDLLIKNIIRLDLKIYPLMLLDIKVITINQIQFKLMFLNINFNWHNKLQFQQFVEKHQNS